MRGRNKIGAIVFAIALIFLLMIALSCAKKETKEDVVSKTSPLEIPTYNQDTVEYMVVKEEDISCMKA